MWISTDPALPEYLPKRNPRENSELPGNGGILNPINLNMYGYVQNNPMVMTDPNGETPFVGSRDLGGSPLGQHAFVVIITNDPKQYGKFSGLFKAYVNKSDNIPGVKKGETYYAAILSGDQSNNYPHKEDSPNKLIKVPNQQNDVDSLKERSEGTSWYAADSDLNLSELTGKKGVSELDLDMGILKAFDKYNGKAAYTLVPDKGKAEYNSNSFSRSISEKGGVTNYPKNLPGYDPGTDNVLPDTYFE